MVSTLSTQMGADLHLGNNEIREAFGRLVEHPNLYKKHRFCFFIDGLDEYEETRQMDYKAVVDLLWGWTKAAPNDVKVCVSSREYNVFLNTLSADKRLRLQDLTKGDMERYIRNKIGRFDDKVASDFVEPIVTKASGIFLWVGLVVKTLRERLEETQDLSILKEEIDTLPGELEALFWYLLNSVSKSARTRAYKTFAMLEVLDSRFRDRSKFAYRDLSLFAYSFLGDYTKDPKFATQTPFQYANMKRNTRKSRIDQARKTLNGSTRGLVEAIKGSVRHIHRSIPEFLNGREVRDEMASHLQNFKAVDAVSQLFVAELRVRAYTSKSIDRYECGSVLSDVIEMRARLEADRAPYSFLESLESLMIEHCGSDVTPQPTKDLTIDFFIGCEHSIGGPVIIHYPGPPAYCVDPFYVVSPLYISAECGLGEYVAWKIHHDQSIIDTDYKMALLVSIMESRLLSSDGDDGASTQILESLLEQGLSPQAVIHTTVGVWFLWADKDRTVWENFVLSVAVCLQAGWGMEKQPLGRALEKFLEYGADPSLWLCAPHSGSVAWDVDYQNYLDTTVRDSPNQGYVVMRVERNGRKILGGHRHTVFSSCPLFSKAGGASFRGLVEYLELDNEDSLLRLIDRNIRRQEGRGEEGTTTHDEITQKRDIESTFKRAPSSKLAETRE